MLILHRGSTRKFPAVIHSFNYAMVMQCFEAYSAALIF